MSPLVFFHSRNKDSNNHISKKENLESENYFSKTFSFLETIFKHFLPIPKEEKSKRVEIFEMIFRKPATNPMSSNSFQTI